MQKNKKYIKKTAHFYMLSFITNIIMLILYMEDKTWPNSITADYI